MKKRGTGSLQVGLQDGCHELMVVEALRRVDQHLRRGAHGQYGSLPQLPPRTVAALLLLDRLLKSLPHTQSDGLGRRLA